MVDREKRIKVSTLKEIEETKKAITQAQEEEELAQKEYRQAQNNVSELKALLDKQMSSRVSKYKGKFIYTEMDTRHDNAVTGYWFVKDIFVTRMYFNGSYDCGIKGLFISNSPEQPFFMKDNYQQTVTQSALKITEISKEEFLEVVRRSMEDANNSINQIISTPVVYDGTIENPD